MIIIVLISLTVLTLLIILNFRKDNFTTKIDTELANFKEKSADIYNDPSILLGQLNYYYPYNKLYQEYTDKLESNIQKLKSDIDDKKKIYENNLQLASDSLSNLERKISPMFNNVFNDKIILHKYNPDQNDNVKYLSLQKRKINVTDNDGNSISKNKFQIFTNDKCLEQDDKGFYKVAKCEDIDNLTNNQLFNIKYIYDKNMYETVVKNPDHRFPENPDTLKYPVSIIKGKNNHCLNLYNDSISFEPCKYKTSQMFKLENL